MQSITSKRRRKDEKRPLFSQDRVQIGDRPSLCFFLLLYEEAGRNGGGLVVRDSAVGPFTVNLVI